MASSPIPFVHVCGVNRRPRRWNALGELARAEDPDREHGVRLVDVEGAGGEVRVQLGRRPRQLASGDQHAALRPQTGEPGDVVASRAAPRAT